MAGIKVITPPAVEPVTLADVKPQLRIDDDDTSYDDILTPLISAAREWAEGYQNRAYITQTLELALDYWPTYPRYPAIRLPRPPLQAVTSITYGVILWDSANYLVDDYAFIPEVVCASGVSWPSSDLPPANGILVRYVAGYSDADKVPLRIKQAIILLVSHWFENGMCDPPPAVIALLDLDRVVPV